MQWRDYQEQAIRTAGNHDFPNSLVMGALGLTGEAGEVAEHIKKHLFHAHILNRDALKKEIGDVLWYIAFLLDATGISMDDVLQTNLDKLAKRYPEGFDADRSINREE